MIFCNKKTCIDNENGQRCGKTNAVLFDGICRYERDRMLRWFNAQIGECELAIKDGSGNIDYWTARKNAFEEVLKQLNVQ